MNINKWKEQQIQTLEVYVSCEILMKTNIKKMMMMMNQVNFSLFKSFQMRSSFASLQSCRCSFSSLSSSLHANAYYIYTSIAYICTCAHTYVIERTKQQKHMRIIERNRKRERETTHTHTSYHKHYPHIKHTKTQSE